MSRRSRRPTAYAMDLKNRLCDIETNRCDDLHGPVPPNQVTPSATTVRGTYVPVEEPSTASLTDPSATPSPIEGIVVTSRHLIGSQLEGTVSAIGSNGLRFLQATLG